MRDCPLELLERPPVVRHPKQLKPPLLRQTGPRSLPDRVSKLLQPVVEAPEVWRVNLPKPPPVLELWLLTRVWQLPRRVKRPSAGRVALHQKDVPTPTLPQVTPAMPVSEVQALLRPDSHDSLVYGPQLRP